MKPRPQSSRHRLVDQNGCADKIDSVDKVEKLSAQLINRKSSGWDEAILDAKKLIAEAEQKISDLRFGIKEFQRRKAAGELWPGTVRASADEPKSERPRRLHQASE